MKDKFIRAYMDVAKRFAELSSAKRLHVGAIIVKDQRIISIGYNGTPAGWDNNCEEKIYDPGAGPFLTPEEYVNSYPYEEWHDQAQRVVRYRLSTKPEVLHAEMNALMKLARSTESGENSTLFITHSPCMECAKGIFQAGIKQVFYGEDYRSSEGIDFLKKCNISVIQVGD